MEPPPKPASTSLFQVYLRLRPPPAPMTPTESLYPILSQFGRFLTVEEPSDFIQDAKPTHITITPPAESRRRAVEKFAFTRVFEEGASQLDLFKGTGVITLLEGVVGANGHSGRDGLLATLGMTGSGKVQSISWMSYDKADNVDSYYTWFTLSTWADSTVSRRFIPISSQSPSSSYFRPFPSPFARPSRCIGSAAAPGSGLLGQLLWRQRIIESWNANDGTR